MRTIKQIIIHHSATDPNWTIDKSEDVIASSHKTTFNNPDSFGNQPQYHYMVSLDGTSRNTRDTESVGWHCGNLEVNKVSLGICLLNDFRFNQLQTPQRSRLVILLKDLVAKYNITRDNIKCHRDIVATQCPVIPQETIESILDEVYMDNVSDWAIESWQKAKAKGIVKDNPKDTITKEQLIVLLDRAGLLN